MSDYKNLNEDAFDLNYSKYLENNTNFLKLTDTFEVEYYKY